MERASIILAISLILTTLNVYSIAMQKNEQSEYTLERLGFIEKLDDELDHVLDPANVPEIIGEGFSWSEGPVWVDEHEFLLFSDVPKNLIYKWSMEKGVVPYLQPSGYTGSAERGGGLGSNGLIIGLNGELLLCQHGDRRIARMDAPLDEPQPEFSTVTGSYGGKRFNSPNDLVQHSSGSIYFTDPPYGLEGYVNDPARELDFHGVFRADPDGSVTLLTDELSRPNGLAFSPDKSLLYVANSDRGRAIWMVYDVLDNGDIANGRLFYNVTEHVGKEPGLPDGMKVNRNGIIFATGPGGVWIFKPDATVLGIVKTGEFISNLAFDTDESTLYMTADSYLLRLRL
jgi:gluconolactonase